MENNVTKLLQKDKYITTRKVALWNDMQNPRGQLCKVISHRIYVCFQSPLPPNLFVNA